MARRKEFMGIAIAADVELVELLKRHAKAECRTWQNLVRWICNQYVLTGTPPSKDEVELYESERVSKLVKTIIEIHFTTYEILTAQAKDGGYSRSKLVRWLLNQYLEAKEKANEITER